MRLELNHDFSVIKLVVVTTDYVFQGPDLFYVFEFLSSGTVRECLERSKLSVKKKNHLDSTEWFIALIICSTCFGHFYAHHQELETICVLLPPMVCSAWLLVVGVRCRAAGYASSKSDVARLKSCNITLPGHKPTLLNLTPDNNQPSTAHHRR